MKRGRLSNMALRIITLCLCIFSASACRAQVPTYVSPQTVTQTLAASGTACTGTAQTFPVNNLGQTQHYAYIRTNSAISNVIMLIQGVDPAGNVYLISDTATTAIPIAGGNSSLLGSGYFSKVQVVVTCLPATTGTFTLNYTGTSATSNQVVGSYLIAQQDKTLSSAASAGATYNAIFQTPFGSSHGTLFFQYTGAGPAGSTLNVTCQTQNGTGPGQFQFALATTTATEQTFTLPDQACPNITVQYTSGGPSGATYLFDYVFQPPGISISPNYSHVTTTTATAIKAGSGIVKSLVVGTPVTGTITLFDLVPGSCTGTPASNVVTVINEAAANPPAAIDLAGAQFNFGICAKASVAGDYTVIFQ